MMTYPNSFPNTSAIRIDDRDYFDITLANIESAHTRIWVSMFICDIRPSRDFEGQVLELLHSLVIRRQVGVDVRVLLPGVVRTSDIDVANLSSGVYLTNSGIAHRRVFDDGQRLGSHAKFVLCDETLVIGSQNWTDDGFRENIEDAVLLHGAVVESMANEFIRLWNRGKGMPRS